MLRRTSDPGVNQLKPVVVFAPPNLNLWFGVCGNMKTVFVLDIRSSHCQHPLVIMSPSELQKIPSIEINQKLDGERSYIVCMFLLLLLMR